MLLRVFTLRFSTALEGFDDSPVRDFVKDKEILALGEHFFVNHGVPYLTVVVTYTLSQLAASPSSAPQEPQKRDESWRDLLPEGGMPLFNTLRDWRSTRSKREGLPPYIICTNRQLALMVQHRPQTLAALEAIDGFGKTKVERYGKEILALLARLPETPPAQGNGTGTREATPPSNQGGPDHAPTSA